MKTPQMTKKIFSPIKIGRYTLPNRICMAALTRCRADHKTSIPNDLHVKYYSERAENTGFILTECAGVEQRGNCFLGGCGIWNDSQVQGWKRVCDAVHKVKGRIFLQIWHAGRAARESVVGCKPVGPSAIPIRIPKKDGNGFTFLDTPEELTEEGILHIVKLFRKGAENALKAGFDGVQLHGANGYLIDQFLRDASNKRKDKYGGTIEKRCRFPLMVIDELIKVFGADRVGIKITPVGRLQDMFDSDPISLYTFFLKELSNRKISFVELVKAPEFRPTYNFYKIEGEDQIPDVYTTFRPYFNGALIANNKMTLDSANKLIESEIVDAVTFGRLFIANPDLVNRFKNNLQMNPIREKLFYNGGEEGYTDYPKYDMLPKF